MPRGGWATVEAVTEVLDGAGGASDALVGAGSTALGAHRVALGAAVVVRFVAAGRARRMAPAVVQDEAELAPGAAQSLVALDALGLARHARPGRRLCSNPIRCHRFNSIDRIESHSYS